MKNTGTNVFEGARRISLSIKVLWVLCFAALLYIQTGHMQTQQTPSVTLIYKTEGPHAPFEPADYCGINDAEKVTDVILDAEKTASITLCFEAQKFEDGRILVPYSDEEGKWWGGEKDSIDVSKYARRRSVQFVLPQKGKVEALNLWEKQVTRLRREWWSELLKIVGISVAGGIGGWLTISIITKVIGWIVRGFLGIPSGQDTRADTVEAPNHEISKF